MKPTNGRVGCVGFDKSNGQNHLAGAQLQWFNCPDVRITEVPQKCNGSRGATLHTQSESVDFERTCRTWRGLIGLFFWVRSLRLACVLHAFNKLLIDDLRQVDYTESIALSCGQCMQMMEL